MSNGISGNAGHVQRPDGLLALASTLPTDVSHSPVLGIVGVVMGAAIVTLAGRLLSLGLADLKGNVGIGFDEGAWISSAFNVAIMFIGPLTVYLGAILGARRVLLFSSAVFALVSVALPYVHSYSLMICLLAIAGLSSGTFYPLTLSFVLRNIPLRYLALAIALYATAVEGAVNFAPSLYGFYRDHLSWTWMFWTSALVAPVMTACVYYGIPAAPGPRPSGQKPSFVGFLYASVGLALLYAALDQGQRLDWWRSGLFTALFTTGSVLPPVRCGSPSAPSESTGGPAIPPQVEHAGPGIRCVCVPFLPARDGPGHSADAGRARIRRGSNWSRRGVDGDSGVVSRLLRSSSIEQRSRFRVLMASGFAVMGIACLMNASVTSAWTAENYFRTELLMAVGQSFAFVGLVATIILQAFFSGALDSPSRVLTFSAFFHVVRLFAGQVGVTVLARFIAEQEKLHSYLVGLHVQTGDWIADQTVRLLAGRLVERIDRRRGSR